jgi:hypothetical protein
MAFQLARLDLNRFEVKGDARVTRRPNKLETKADLCVYHTIRVWEIGSLMSINDCCRSFVSQAPKEVIRRIL